jgi:prepilin-type N-terminal cleavage/methylation domain-containing protein
MMSRGSRSPVSRQRGFTITELLVVMALIVFVMIVLSEAFTTGLETFRKLKAVGDQQEQLRTASLALRRDLDAAHFDANSFIIETYLNGKANREDAAALRARYEAIAADAGDLKVQFSELESRTTNPAAKRVIQQIEATLDLIKWHAGNMIVIIRAIEDDDDDDAAESSGALSASAR